MSISSHAGGPWEAKAARWGNGKVSREGVGSTGFLSRWPRMCAGKGGRRPHQASSRGELGVLLSCSTSGEASVPQAV